MMPNKQQQYNALGLIISEYEKRAFQSMTRPALMAMMVQPLSAMEALALGSERLLDNEPLDLDNIGPRDPEEEELVTRDLFSFLSDAFSEGATVEAGLDDLFPNLEGSWLDTYIAECLRCRGRISFRWQIQPLNWMGHLERLLEQLENQLDFMENLSRPSNALSGICNLMNQMDWKCIPDYLMLLYAINALMGRYSSNMMQIRLDWTILFGPLLRAIIQVLADAVNAAAAVGMPPLNCLETVAATVVQGESLVRNTIANAVDMASIAGTANLDVMQRELFTTEAESEDFVWPNAPELGELQSRNTVYQPDKEESIAKKISKGIFDKENGAFFTGFQMSADTRLGDAIMDPAFRQASVTQKFLLLIRDVKFFIRDITSEINNSLGSINSLVGNSMNVDLRGLGVLVFLLDMISLITGVVRLLMRRVPVGDWCEFLAENPEIFNDLLPGVDNAVVDAENQRILLREGPNVVSYIDTCTNARQNVQSELLQSWINDLNRKP